MWHRLWIGRCPLSSVNCLLGKPPPPQPSSPAWSPPTRQTPDFSAAPLPPPSIHPKAGPQPGVCFRQQFHAFSKCPGASGLKRTHHPIFLKAPPPNDCSRWGTFLKGFRRHHPTRPLVSPPVPREGNRTTRTRAQKVTESLTNSTGCRPSALSHASVPPPRAAVT